MRRTQQELPLGLVLAVVEALVPATVLVVLILAAAFVRAAV